MKLHSLCALCVSVALLPVGAFAQSGAPEQSLGRTEQTEAYGKKTMVVTANPLASRAADAILAEGGTAADAAIAASAVLGLVEPQSSGLGGGGFLLYRDGHSHHLESYDGRESAPANATMDLFIGPDGKPLNLLSAIASGRVVGTPGLVRLIDQIHRAHGRLPIAQIFQPAIALAENGFPVPHRLALLVATMRRYLEPFDDVHGYLFDASGEPITEGSILKNPAYAATLRDIAMHGPSAFYEGARAKRIVERIARAIDGGPMPTPMRLSLSDLKAYRSKLRPPVCLFYREHNVCSMGPPSAGGLVELEILGQLESFDLSAMKPDEVFATHLMLEASRRAFADRDRYVGDPDFVPVPMLGLLERDYLQARSMTIDPAHVVSQTVAPGIPKGVKELPAPPKNMDQPSTSHVSIVDSERNAVSLTQSIETAFGSRLMVDGFILNNHLTDFSFQPVRDAHLVANAPGPRKRPRSTMAPTIVIDRQDRLEMVAGSPGGSAIPGFVVKTLIAHFDWHMDAQAAVDWPIAINRNGVTEIEKDTALAALKPQLEAMGHEVRLVTMSSGLNVIVIEPDGLSGASDPRRDGLAIGH